MFVCVCVLFFENFRHSNGQWVGAGQGGRPLQFGTESLALELQLGLGLGLVLGLRLGLGLGLWLNLVVTRFKVSQLMRKFRCKKCFFIFVVAVVFCMFVTKFVYNKYRNC